MRITVVARRYAKALAGMAQSAAQLDIIAEDLEKFQSFLESEEALKKALYNPGLTPAARLGLCTKVAEALGLIPHIISLLRLMTEKGRIRLFPQVAEAFQEIVDARAGRIRAHILTARPLTEGMTAEVRKALETSLRKTVIMSVEHDPTLLGGLIARIGSQVYDFSLRTQLERLRKSIAQGD